MSSWNGHIIQRKKKAKGKPDVLFIIKSTNVILDLTFRHVVTGSSE